MDKGQKDKREKNKISPFDITDEMLEDPELDAFLKESLKQEADEIEAELEEDLSLRGIGASDDMFDAIVEELKEQGIWEEESAAEKEKQNPAPEQDEETEAVAESLESLYAKLPPEDREALELGRKAVQKEQKRKIRRRKRNKILKRGGTVAAALAVVFGLSMTSEANRRLVLRAWEGLMYNFGFRVATDYVGEENARRTRDLVWMPYRRYRTDWELPLLIWNICRGGCSMIIIQLPKIIERQIYSICIRIMYSV